MFATPVSHCSPRIAGRALVAAVVIFTCGCDGNGEVKSGGETTICTADETLAPDSRFVKRIPGNETTIPLGERLFDLGGKTLRFVPGHDGYDLTVEPMNALTFEENRGSFILVGMNEVELPFDFPFAGSDPGALKLIHPGALKLIHPAPAG